VSCWIRARYHPDQNTVSLPEFIHGKIVARFDVTDVKFYGIPLGIRATATADDDHITFTDSAPASADSQKVAGVIRDVLRTRVNAFLSFSPDFPSGPFDFQALTDGQGRQAVALPITLDGAEAGAGSPGQIFLDSSDFAIAVSKELILALMQPDIDQFNQAPKPPVDILGTTYKLSMTAALAWNGALTLSVSGTAKTSTTGFSNVTFEVSQGLTFTFNASTQSILIEPSGEPNVKELQFSGSGLSGVVGWVLNKITAVKNAAKSQVTNRFKTERDKALKIANEKINDKLGKQREQLRNLLRKMDDAAEVTLASAPPSPDGLLLKGNISLSLRNQPRVAFSQLGDGSGYTAFDSWVPGGRITQFVWTFWRFADLKNYVPGEQVTSLILPYQDRKFVDRYVLQEPNLPGITPPGPPGTPVATKPPAGNVAVSLEGVNALVLSDPSGVWTLPDGQLCLWIGYEYVDPATGAMLTEQPNVEAVKALNPGVDCMLAAWWPELYAKPSELGPCPEMNVIITQPGENELVSSSEALLQAIRQAGRPDAPLMLVFSLRSRGREPTPTLAAHARELRQKFPQLGVALADRDGHRLRGLDLPADESRPALRLLDPAGRLAWRHDGAADATTIAAALRAHLVAGTPPSGRVPAAGVQSGKRPPDFTFEVAPGNRIALRHFRGRRFAIIFVSEGDAALERVLRHLSASTGEAGERRMFVIIVRDREPGGTATARHEPSLDWIAVPDPERTIARSYGIMVRPTTVLVDWDGRVSGVLAMSTTTATLRRPSGGHGAERR
jgi:hypothetical protein